MFKILVGLALLLIGLCIFSSALKVYFADSNLPAIDKPWLMALISLGGTLLWQSSSITTVLLVGIVSGGLIGLEAGIAGISGADTPADWTTIQRALSDTAVPTVSGTFFVNLLLSLSVIGQNNSFTFFVFCSRSYYS